ncbi:MAG: cytidine deaminase [Saprospiraceae bacterium]|nr:cytidine deaminase [Saprospiraceae bacterium]
MKEISINLTIKCYDSYEELSDSDERRLCNSAFESLNHAYAPYSNYKVGAAVLLDDNHIVEGSNQENAVFPLGLCAERVAIFSSNTLYPKAKIKAIAVVTLGDVEKGKFPGFPCGSCRQVMIDMEYRHQQNIKVFVLDKNKNLLVVDSVKELLPIAFDHSAL